MAEVRTTLYRVTIFIRWDELVSSVPGYPIPVPAVADCGVGFWPVFDSREEAEKLFPGKEIVEFYHIKRTGVHALRAREERGKANADL